MIYSEVSFYDKTAQNQSVTTKKSDQNSSYSFRTSQNLNNIDFNYTQ